MPYLKNIFIVLMIASPQVLFVAQALAGSKQVEFIKAINSKWVSSDRYISVDALTKQAFEKIPKQLLRQLSRMGPRELVAALQQASREGENINQGIAENLIKIRQIDMRLELRSPVNPRPGEVVFGLTQERIDGLVKNLPAKTERQAREFDNIAFEMRRAFEVSVAENDFYAIKIAAKWWATDESSHMTTISEVFARGKEEVSLMAAVGQDRVLQMMEQLRFEEADIQQLRSHPSLREIPEGFWAYLRKWRYAGDVEMVPSGTLITANTPFMQFKANPIDTALVETPVLALLDEFTRAATYANRAVTAAGGRPLIEGGARRGLNGFIRALGAYIAGFAGTSDVRAARLFGIPAMGSAENHSSIGQHENEIRAHSSVLQYYAPEQSFLLTDTYDLERGVKAAIRAGGKDIRGFRIDSMIPEKTVEETIVLVDKWLKESGFLANDVAISAHPSLFSDDLNETRLQSLTDSKAPFGFALIGGRLRNGPALGLVLKTTFVTRSGKDLQVIKISNPEKALWPGAKQVYRKIINGIFAGDIVARKEEAAPENSIPLRVAGMRDGKVIRGTIEAIQIQRERMEEQRAKMPPEAQSIAAKFGTYPLIYSQELSKLRREVVAAHSPSSAPRIGVFPYSGDPTHDGHVETVKAMKARYMLDRVYVVPTGPTPIHGKNHALSPEVRLKLAREKFADVPGVIVYDGESKDPNPVATRDTLAKVQKIEGENADVYVMFGSDALATLPSFRGAGEIVQKYNVIAAQRSGQQTSRNAGQRPSDFPPSIIGNHDVLDRNGNVLESRVNGKVIELGDYPHLPQISSTAIRNFYDSLSFAYLLHVTDPQWTFLTRSLIPTSQQKENGTLAVAGTELTVNNIATIVQVTEDAGEGRTSLSGDAHFEAEVQDASQNGEFHEPTKFGHHGMKGQNGPQGDSLIQEVEEVIPKARQIVIPNHEEVVKKDGKRVLVQAFFDMDAIRQKLFDPRYVPRFEKNGVGAYSVHANPHYAEYLQTVDPARILPHFHLGWCTDFCLVGAAEAELDQGYRVYIIIDAIAGVFPNQSAAALKRMAGKGALFVSTAEYVGLARQWQKQKANWAQVINSLDEWERHSRTQELVLKELERDFWKNELPVSGECSVILLGL